MSAAVLDASTLLALLRGEPGARAVEGVLGCACMSVVGMPLELVDQMLWPLR